MSSAASAGGDFYFDLRLPRKSRERAGKSERGYPPYLRVVVRLDPARTNVAEVLYAFAHILPPEQLTRIAPAGGFSGFFASGGDTLGAIAAKGGNPSAFLQCLGTEVAIGHYFGGLTGAALHTSQGHSSLLRLLPKELRYLVDNDMWEEYAA